VQTNKISNWPVGAVNMKAVSPFMVALILLAAAMSAAEVPPPVVTLLEPSPVANGGVLMLELDTGPNEDPVVGLQAKFQNRPVAMFGHPQGEPGRFIGLVGISYHHQPGTEHVVLEWTDRNGYHSRRIPFEIVSGRYRSEKLRVQPRKASPQPSDVDRIRREKEAVSRAYRQAAPLRLWQAPFQLPTDGPVTSPYGSRRLFNGKTRSYHNGVDFRAPLGTPIYAANTGIVLLAENLFYSGNVVILDHGAGVFTSYSHLSVFSVSAGDLVEKGRQIGLAGRTGRTSGPHLHWSAKVTGASVDPLQLIERLNSLFSHQAEKELTGRPSGHPAAPNR
jgi:hypothetical protein